MDRKMPWWAVALLGGSATALAVAIPIVDDGILLSEWLSIGFAFLTGTGLTAYRPPERPVR